MFTCDARLYRIAWQCLTSCEKYEVGDNFTTRTMGDEKPIRVRPTRSSFNNNTQLQTSQVENIGNTLAFGWANAIFSLAYALALAKLCTHRLDPKNTLMGSS